MPRRVDLGLVVSRVLDLMEGDRAGDAGKVDQGNDRRQLLVDGGEGRRDGVL